MNGESASVPQVPVSTLAGTVSLTELLPELPLPSATDCSQSRSLLFHPRVAEEAQRHLTHQDKSLAVQLAQALAATSADHIELKSRFVAKECPAVDLKTAPPLLKGILQHSPNAFANEGRSIKVESLSSTLVNSNKNSAKSPIVNNHVDRNVKKELVKKEGATPLLNRQDINHASLKKEPVLKLTKLTNQETLNNVGSPKVCTDDSREALRSRSVRSNSLRSKSRAVTVESGDDEDDDEDEEFEDGSSKKPLKYFKSREREREEKRRKDKAERKRKRPDSDEDYDPSTSKRSKASEDEDDSDGATGPSTSRTSKQGAQAKISPKKVQYNKKRLERKLDCKYGSEKLSNEELMETGVYQRFTRIVEKIFDNTEDIDFNAEIDEDGDVPQEYLIPKYDLSELCSESAKLKSLGAMSLVPPERLVRLLNILEKNIRDGAKVTPLLDEDEEEEEKLWMELVLERILRAMDASLTTLYILTSPNMSKRVYLEDIIERCVQFAKFQLSNTIYPSFDPVYRIDSKKDGFIGSAKRRRAHTKDVRDRNILGLYSKLHILVGLVADLLSIQTLTDTTILFLSTLGVAPFFVENIPELQLSSLKLVTQVFSKYEKHRRLLLDDILASIARLPSSKRNLRTYRLNSDENIQMLTALVLQLIQCVVDLPEMQATNKTSTSSSSLQGGSNKDDSKKTPDSKNSNADQSSEGASTYSVDRDVLVSHKYETAMRTGYSFLSVFLEKTGSRNEEIDYRPLFENFVQDLLMTVNKPEWPASELLLSFLGKLLVKKFSHKNTDITLRVSSLDCLGVVAARLRRDAVTSRLKVDQIDQIIAEVRAERDKDAPVLEDGVPAENDSNDKKKKCRSGKKKSTVKGDENEIGSVSDVPFDQEEERTIFLQQVLLDWLAVNSGSEAALLHARHFYIGQWYRDAFAEIMQQKRGPPTHPGTTKNTSKSRRRKKRSKGVGSSEDDDTDSEDLSDDEDENFDEDTKAEITKLAERRKKLLLQKVPAFPPANPGVRTQTLQTHIDYENAELITRYLASKRSFSQSFDSYLKQILHVLTESAIAVRTKAMKCLTMVVDADPSVLGRSDMQLGVRHSFLDHSTSVREAAVDLVGRFVLLRPELIHKYYEIISERILDTGVSVRKRVIKIMKDICIEYPNFDKIPQICVKMIRRVNDEEGIKKLVQEVFQVMWFTPVRERPHLDQEALLLKVNNITEVVIACKDTGLDWFEQLLHSLFRPKEDKEDVTKICIDPPKSLVTACSQIVDCLVNHILVIDEGKGFKGSPASLSSPCDGKEFINGQVEAPTQAKWSVSQRLVACLRTLYLFAKIRPQLVIKHAYTLQPYLSLKCQTQGDYSVIGTVARTLELVVPLMQHPSETFLSQLEEDSVKLILLHDKSVINSCLALLGSIVNTVTRNYRLIKDCFNKYYSFIVDYHTLIEGNPSTPMLEKTKPHLRRALYTVGLLLRHFDFRDATVRSGLPPDIAAQVVDTLMYFTKLSDKNVRFGAVQAIGSVCIRHYDLMTTKRVKELYLGILRSPASDHVQLKVQALVNVESYLQEEEIRMIKQDQEWAKMKTKENLKEMCDIQSGMASAIIQIYLHQILESVIDANLTIRHTALRVVLLVLAQGLVHPIPIVPYLIAMSTDHEELISHTADKQLQDIEKKYPGFVNMKAMQGFRLSFRLQRLIQSQLLTRGVKQKKDEYPAALNGFLYSIMRGTKNQRRAVAMSLLKQFDEQARVPLPDLLFIADNLAYFPYQVIDEPLFVIHYIDVMISVTGSNLLQAFKENLKRDIDPSTGQTIITPLDEEEEDVTAEEILERLPEDVGPLVEAMDACQGCLLLLFLKNHLKELYGITDNKIWHYSPSDTSRQYEKSLGSRKSLAKFNPKATLQKISSRGQQNPSTSFTPHEKQSLVLEYLSFRDLMLRMDREEDSDEDCVPTAPHSESSSSRFPSRSLRLQQRTNDKSHDALLLPGTLDSWQGDGEKKEDIQHGHPAAEAQNNDDGAVDQERRSPIKPITIRASQIAAVTTADHKRHKKKKRKKEKKKKRRRISDSDSDEEDDEDPDFVVA